jgi:methylenetetrahydrofolate dehydrogenase (NADP+)/methenyltetrahydrofolate cyclohydrolase
MEIIDGKAVALNIKQEIAQEMESLNRSRMRSPHLAAILVGHDGASETYVAHKIKDCEEVGFKSSLIRLPEQITEEELLEEIDKLNRDPHVDGFIVQLPLPGHIHEQKIIEAIDPCKDVDGFHPVNVGRSNIVGRPLSILMSQKAMNATVSVAHSRTSKLDELCRSADILITALGSPGFIHAGMVKEGAVVIDVGTTRVPDVSRKSGFRLTGDVKFDEVAPRCSHITPVPDGVGPMTRVSLLSNTLKALKNKC